MVIHIFNNLNCKVWISFTPSPSLTFKKVVHDGKNQYPTNPGGHLDLSQCGLSKAGGVS